MGVRNTKSFTPLTETNVSSLGAHMGVYELASDTDEVVFVGFAGGKSLFGLRGEIASHLGDTRVTGYRIEVTTAYMTRYQELLMVFVADHGRLPAHNQALGVHGLGRLSPG